MSESVSRQEPVIKKSLFGNTSETESHSISTSSRPVLLPDEVLRLAKEQKILIHFIGSDLLKADKYPYTAMVDADEIVEADAFQHVPEWAVNQSYYPPNEEEENDKSNLTYTPKTHGEGKDNPSSGEDDGDATVNPPEESNETVPIYNQHQSGNEKQSDDDFGEVEDEDLDRQPDADTAKAQSSRKSNKPSPIQSRKTEGGANIKDF